MKKTLLLIPAVLLGVISCGNETNSSEPSYAYGLKILAPTGAPALALYNLANESRETFETTTNPKEGLLPMFIKGKYDVIVAPTQGGLMQVVKQHAEYKIAATITFGNFYIYSCGTDADQTLNDGDKVLIFQAEDLPGKIFNYCYGNLNLTINDVPGADDTKLVIGDNGMYDGVQYDYVFTAEPVLSSLNKTAFIDVQEDFKTKSDGLLLTQASVFIKNGTNENSAKSFLSSLKTSIELAISNPSAMSSKIASIGNDLEQKDRFGVTANIAKKVMENGNSIGIGYTTSFDIKDDIQNFVNAIAPAIGTLDEEVFYK